MAGVVNKTLTQEERIADAESMEQREEALVAKLIKQVDLPSNLADQVDAIAEKNDREPEDEEEQEQEEETVAKSKDKEEESDSEEEEDLIPKSKVQKRFDEMTANQKRLEAELQRLKSERPAPAKDEDLAKLEEMSDSELRALKRQVKTQQIKSYQDEAALEKLVDLEEKVDSVLAQAPQRFAQRQIQAFNEAVQVSSFDPEIKDFANSSKQIFASAKMIYDESPELQKSETGQARAWQLAVNHQKALSKLTDGKSKVENLKRENNTLKRKVSIDTSSTKGQDRDTSSERLFNKAKHGDVKAQDKWLRSKIDVSKFVPEEFRTQS